MYMWLRMQDICIKHLDGTRRWLMNAPIFCGSSAGKNNWLISGVEQKLEQMTLVIFFKNKLTLASDTVVEVKVCPKSSIEKKATWEWKEKTQPVRWCVAEFIYKPVWEKCLPLMLSPELPLAPHQRQLICYWVGWLGHQKHSDTWLFPCSVRNINRIVNFQY